MAENNEVKETESYQDKRKNYSINQEAAQKLGYLTLKLEEDTGVTVYKKDVLEELVELAANTDNVFHHLSDGIYKKKQNE